MRHRMSLYFNQLKPHKGAVTVLGALIFVGVASQALTPWTFKLLIDNVIGQQAFPAGGIEGRLFSAFVSPLSLGFIVVLLYTVSIFISHIVDYCTDFSIKKLGRTIVLDFAKKAFARVAHYPISHFRRTDIGDYIYRLSYDASAIGELFEAGFVPFVYNAVAVVVTGIILVCIHPLLGILALFMAPLLVGLLLWFNKRIGKATRISESSNSLLFSYIQEVLSQIKIVQAFTRETYEIEQFQKKETVALNRELRLTQIQLLFSLCIGVVIALGYALVISYGIGAVLSGTMTAGFLIAFIFYLDNFTGPLLGCANAFSSAKENASRVDRLSQLTEKKIEETGAGVAIGINNSDIICKGVHVFGDDNVHILKNVSVTIPKNKVTVVVGTNGSGKTTFISLLLRFMDVAEGTLKIDGRDIATYSYESLRQAVAYVPQEVELFGGTVKENIVFGNMSASDDDVVRAAKFAVADGFIKNFPGTYGFNVGEGGARLSGGQRQRILLARTILKRDAPFLVMDEPFSALDIRTYRKVIQIFPQWTRGKTVIIVSNVLQIIEKADFVIVFNEGRIIYTGTADGLKKDSTISDFLLSIA